MGVLSVVIPVGVAFLGAYIIACWRWAHRWCALPLTVERGTALDDGPEAFPAERERLHTLEEWAITRGMTDIGWAALPIGNGLRGNLHIFNSADGLTTLYIQFVVAEVSGQFHASARVIIDLISNFDDGMILMTTTMPRGAGADSDLYLHLPMCQDPEALLRIHTARLDRFGRGEFMQRPATVDEILDASRDYEARLFEECCAEGTMHQVGDAYFHTHRSMLRNVFLVQPVVRQFALARLRNLDRKQLRELGLSELWSTR